MIWDQPRPPSLETVFHVPAMATTTSTMHTTRTAKAATRVVTGLPSSCAMNWLRSKLKFMVESFPWKEARGGPYSASTAFQSSMLP